MDLPISDQDLEAIVNSLKDTEHKALYDKLFTIKEIRDKNPGGPYKKIAREQFGFVL